MKGKKIIVRGAYGDGNIGDDLLLEMVFQLLMKNKINSNNIYIAGKKATYLRKLYRGCKFLSVERVKYESCDYFILGGGTQFFSFGRVVSKRKKILNYFKIIIREPGIIYQIFKNRFSTKIFNPVRIALSIGLGPFINKDSEVSTKRRLQEYSHVWVRDLKSLEYCNIWEINASLSADLCLSDNFKNNYPFTHKLNSDEKKIVGIVIRDWPHNDKGNQINESLFDWIEITKAFEVKIFIFSKYKDKNLLDEIRSRGILGESDLFVWDPDSITFQDYFSNFNSCDIIVTSRYHAAIFALNFSIPTICLAIDPKLKYLTEEVEGFNYIEINEIETLNLSIDKILQNYSDCQDKISKSYNELNKRANEIAVSINKIFK